MTRAGFKRNVVIQLATGIALLVLVLLAVDYASALAPEWLDGVQAAVAAHGLLGAFAIVFLGSTLLPFPTDVAFASLLRVSADRLPLLTVGVLAAFLAGLVNYGLARFVRGRWLERLAGPHALRKAKETVDAYGPTALLVFGAIPASPVFDAATLVAGLAGMEFRTFALYLFASRVLHFGILAALTLGVPVLA